LDFVASRTGGFPLVAGTRLAVFHCERHPYFVNGPGNSRHVRFGAIPAQGGGAGGAIHAQLALVASAGALLAFLGPFGTYDLPPLSRLACWLGLTLIAWLVYKAALLTGRRSALLAGLSRAAGEALGILIGTVAVAVMVKGVISSLYPAARLPFDTLLIQTAVIGCLIYFPVRQLPARLSTPERHSIRAPKLESDDNPGAAFFRRLPPIFERELLCLEMEDHYVRVHAAGSSTLLLMRMRDAVAELEGVRGARVGRSWWVRRDAVVGIVRSGRTIRLELRNGQTVPVARSQVSRLRELGWLAGTAAKGADDRRL
jgi:hypothetical protein